MNSRWRSIIISLVADQTETKKKPASVH